jgi:hypothetical protein
MRFITEHPNENTLTGLQRMIQNPEERRYLELVLQQNPGSIGAIESVITFCRTHNISPSNLTPATLWGAGTFDALMREPDSESRRSALQNLSELIRHRVVENVPIQSSDHLNFIHRLWKESLRDPNSETALHSYLQRHFDIHPETTWVFNADAELRIFRTYATMLADRTSVLNHLDDIPEEYRNFLSERFFHMITHFSNPQDLEQLSSSAQTTLGLRSNPETRIFKTYHIYHNPYIL